LEENQQTAITQDSTNFRNPKNVRVFDPIERVPATSLLVCEWLFFIIVGEDDDGSPRMMI
jgi:hypothetical protein